MNISVPIGLVVAFGLMVFGMGFGKESPLESLSKFWDPPSVLITIGGMFATLLATFPLKILSRIFQNYPIIMGLRKQDPIYHITIMTDLSQEARKKGLLALEDSVAEIDDAFLRDSVVLIVDDMEPELAA